MKKAFYLLWFSYCLENGDSSDFDLGLFSSKKNAEKKMETVADKNGFKDFPKSNFEIIKIFVNFSANIIDKTNVRIYCLWQEYTDDAGTEWWRIYGYYSNKKEAIIEKNRLILHSRLGKKYPKGIQIDECLVDCCKDWEEGFDYI